MPLADLALIGHQESWDKIASIVTTLRSPTREALTRETLREIVPWIPARTVSRVRFPDAHSRKSVTAVYIDTFITPDELEAGAVRVMVGKVHDAVRVAEREGTKLGTLGGFTSIVLEGRARELSEHTKFTTGNTLTAAFIAQGVERAAGQIGLLVERATMLIVGATGDIGSACARWFAPRVARLLIAARSRNRLRALVDAPFPGVGAVETVDDLDAAVARADIIITAASNTSPLLLRGIKPGALVCDAGYPKNIVAPNEGAVTPHVFWGGMGVSRAGIHCSDGMLDAFYRFPVAGVAHGCLLEGVVLALAGRYESYSEGRGAITVPRMEEMVSLAEHFGYTVAPCFNASGTWPTEPTVDGTSGVASPRMIHS